MGRGRSVGGRQSREARCQKQEMGTSDGQMGRMGAYFTGMLGHTWEGGWDDEDKDEDEAMQSPEWTAASHVLWRKFSVIIAGGRQGVAPRRAPCRLVVPPSLGPCMGEIQLLDRHFPLRRDGWGWLRGLRGVWFIVSI